MNPISIKRDIYLYLFSLLISLIVFYTVMVNQSYNVGLNEAGKYSLLYEIKLIEQEYLKSGSLPDTNYNQTFQVYTNLAQIPQRYTYVFDWDKFHKGVIYEAYLEKTSNHDAQYLYATYHQIKNSSKKLYIISQYNETIYSKLIEQEPPQSFNQFNSVLGAILVVIVFIIVRLLIYRITQPVLALAEWAETLDLDNKSSIQNLRYKELNTLSQQLTTSLEKLREAIDREAFFLQAASHELRTPITVISASTEMLQRVQDGLPNSSQRAINRISRSIITMQELMTTLLWVARENKQKLETSNIALKPLVDSIINENNYLIRDKDVTIKITSEENFILKNKVETLVRIVVMNLIRNAFQHADNGIIHIELSSQRLSVSNSVFSKCDQKNKIKPTSYGLGLFLVDKICHKQNWLLKYKEEYSKFIVTIDF